MLTAEAFLLTDHDAYLFREGTHGGLYERLGCHLGPAGAHFAVWAPNARRVSVVGDFNRWDRNATPLSARTDGTGVWEASVAVHLKQDPYRVVAASSTRHPELTVKRPPETALKKFKDIDEPTLADLAAHCKASLAGYKAPKHLVLVEHIVRSPSGKADYRGARHTAEKAVGG